MENKTISLKQGATERQDAKNIMKYMLMIDWEPVHYITDDSSRTYIERVMLQTEKSLNSLWGVSAMDFFGFTNASVPESLSFLSNTRPNEATTSSAPSFIKMLLHNSIMNSYHAIITELCSNTSLTSYQVRSSYHRLESVSHAIQKGALQLSDTGDVVYKKSNVKKTSVYNEKTDCEISKTGAAASLKKSINLRYDFISEKMPFLLSKSNTKKSLRFNLQYVKLIKEILLPLPHDLYVWNDIKHATTENDVLYTFSRLLKSFYTDKVDINRDNATDVLYNRYITEKYFNVDLLYSLLVNMNRVTSNKHVVLYEDTTLDTISLCRNLPNVFSRNFFIRYAFDHISEETSSFSDYWEHHNFYQRMNLAYETINPNGFYLGHWLHQYKLFIKYFSEYIIPLYNWCFLNLLLEGIEEAHVHANHNEILFIAINEIEAYLKTHFSEMIYPTTLQNMDGIDMFSPKDIESLKDCFQHREIQKLFERICNNNTDTLHITPLSLNSDSRMKEKLKALHDFYIEVFIFPRGQNTTTQFNANNLETSKRKSRNLNADSAGNEYSPTFSKKTN